MTSRERAEAKALIVGLLLIWCAGWVAFGFEKGMAAMLATAGAVLVWAAL
jgi:hypothetical protein